jgi:non-ribosomal peptide synthase protein (TIGR01720 family)
MSLTNENEKLSPEYDENINPAYDIAVIGMAGKFPGANNVDEFWEILKRGIDTIAFFSDEDLRDCGASIDTSDNVNFVRAKPMLEDVEYFDANFFGYTPKEAEIMDPQMRVMHECAWHALEEAGYDPDTYEGAIGFYAGAQDHFSWEARVFMTGAALPSNFATYQFSNKDHVSTRIAYKFNLSGPSFTVETQCSTSMVAMHLACQALLCGECDIAMAGGVTVFTPQKFGYFYQDGMILSSDGHIRTFDQRSRGSIFGEGVAAVVFKPIEEALKDGDNILAVVKSSFITNDGNKKVSYSAPGVEGMTRAIRGALKLAQVDPESIGYVECHGTATALGDQIEVEALKTAFNTDKRQFCMIGAAKSNVGHLDNASGVTAFIKTVLTLKHRLIPPSLHFENPNPILDLENSPFVVNRELTEWKGEYPLKAGVNCFGVGGTNVHIILQEAPHMENETPSPSRKYQLLLLSTKTGTALGKATENLGEFLKTNPGICLADAAYTLQVGRKGFPHRRAVVCASAEDAGAVLANQETSSGDKPSSPHPVVVQTFLNRKDNRTIYFIFSGLGSQYVNMGLELYSEEPVFRDEIDNCFILLQPLMKEDLKSILYPANDKIEEAKEKIKQSEVSQVLLFIFEYALAKLLMKWGINPHGVIGYSFGEYTAACIAGAFSLEDALKLIVSRGRLVQQMPEGAMLSVPLPIDQLKPLLNDELSIAVDNGPSCIVSGARDIVREFEKQLKEKKYMCMPLDTSHAVHSKLMEPILKKLEEEISHITLNEPRIPLISNVTGDAATEGELTIPTYWSSHLRGTVQFARGIKELVKESGAIFIEIGPGWDLSSLVLRYIEDDSDQHVINPVKHPKKNISDVYYLLSKLGWLWLYGLKIDWSGFYCHEKRRRIPLPKYPFERLRYWPEGEEEQNSFRVKSKKVSAKLPNIADWFSLFEWERSQLMADRQPLIAKQSCWLVFRNELNLCSQLVSRLQQEGVDLIIVENGSSFSRLSEGKYTINPQNRDDFYALMKEVQQINHKPVNVIFLWSVGYNHYENLNRETLDIAQDLGLFAVLYLAQVIGKLRFKEKFIFNIVTNELHEVIGNEEIFPEKSTVLPLAKSIQQEFTNIKCRCIDIVLPEPQQLKESPLVNQLWEEFSRKPSAIVIAFRGNHRWVETYKPILLEEVDGDISLLRKKGVYLITGGLGNVGFLLAKYLARTLKAKLILMGRTLLPPRHEWEEFLAAHESGEGIAKKISKILELEKMGSEVATFSADVTDEEAMKHVISEAEKQLGSINGIIHAAGIVDPGTFLLLNSIEKEHFLIQFQPKVYGTLVLHQLFRDKDLDFCLLISSPASILGGLGFAAYGAANMFLDAFVYRVNRNNGTRWLTVNWGDWEKEEKKDRISSVGVALDSMLMEADEGVETFRRILNYCRSSQIVVSAGDMTDRFNQWVKLEFLEDQSKTSKKRSKSLKPRPDLIEPYVAPTDPIEESIIDMWINIFGYEKIGVHDNFFELGGDSLKLVQVVSQLNEAGYKVELKEIFDHQSISELALFVKDKKQVSQISDQQTVIGSIPLTPFQKSLFKNANPDSIHQDNVVILYWEEGFDQEAVEAIFQEIQEHHHSLRMIYKVENGNMRQINQDSDHPLSIQTFDFKNCENPQQRLKEKTSEIRSSINLEKGPLMKLGIFHLDDGDRLFIGIHPLVCDDFSWRILLEDIDSLFQQYQKGKDFELPPPSGSFKLWSEKLFDYSKSNLFPEEKKYWTELEATTVPGIEKDFAYEDNDILDTDCLSISLSEEETTSLLTRSNDPFATETIDILLTALGSTIREIYGHNRFLIALEGNGHEEIAEIFNDIDVSRTVGQFTYLYPVILDMSDENDFSYRIKKNKEILHQVPNKGIGHGVLKHFPAADCPPDIEFKLNPQIRFSYKEHLEGDGERRALKIDRDALGNQLSRNPRGEYHCDLEILGTTVNKHLVVSVYYNKKQYRAESVETLLNQYKLELNRLISHCLAKKDKELTPSDLTYKNLSMEELEDLSKKYQIEDIYRLTPMQEGMLFHHLYEKEHTAHFMQISYRLHGDLNVPIVKKSLNELFKRHEILRTLFIYEDFDYPLQVVLKERQVDFLYEDVRELVVGTGTEKEDFVEKFKEKDRQRSFNLSKDVLVRISVLQLDDADYEFIFSTHHILMDGWCVGILISEFFEIYNSYLMNREYHLPPVNPYRTYIQWLEKRDKAESRRFWAAYLDHYSQPAAFHQSQELQTGDKEFRAEKFFSQWDEETTNSLNQLAERNRVTLNTTIQTIWGILLGKYNGRQDVIFGAVVSGRPYELKGIETLVGLFINTVPVRIRYNGKTIFNQLLKDIQKAAIECESHYYYPLAEIQAESPLKNELFDHFLDFTNYPRAKQLQEKIDSSQESKKGSGLRISREESFDHSTYDLSVMIVASQNIHMRFDYNGNAVNREWVERIANHLELISKQVLANEEIPIDELSLLSEEEKRKLIKELRDRDGQLDLEEIDQKSSVRIEADFDF